MKLLSILCFLLFFGCGSALKLTRQDINAERATVHNYYADRAAGYPFRASFYDARDSVSRSLASNDARIFGFIYLRIAHERSKDSETYWLHPSVFFGTLARELDNDFDIARGAY